MKVGGVSWWIGKEADVVIFDMVRTATIDGVLSTFSNKCFSRSALTLHLDGLIVIGDVLCAEKLGTPGHLSLRDGSSACNDNYSLIKMMLQWFRDNYMIVDITVSEESNIFSVQSAAPALAISKTKAVAEGFARMNNDSFEQHAARSSKDLRATMSKDDLKHENKASLHNATPTPSKRKAFILNDSNTSPTEKCMKTQSMASASTERGVAPRKDFSNLNSTNRTSFDPVILALKTSLEKRRGSPTNLTLTTLKRKDSAQNDSDTSITKKILKD